MQTHFLSFVIMVPNKLLEIYEIYNKWEKIVPLSVRVLWRTLTRFCPRIIQFRSIGWVSIRYGMNLHEDSNTKMIWPTWTEVKDMNHNTQKRKIKIKNNFNPAGNNIIITKYGHEKYILTTRDKSTKQIKVDLLIENVPRHSNHTVT